LDFQDDARELTRLAALPRPQTASIDPLPTTVLREDASQSYSNSTSAATTIGLLVGNATMPYCRPGMVPYLRSI
jgi:hypothetical protein